MKKTLFVILVLCLNTAAVLSQELHLVVHDKPLNTVLNTLNLEISYNDQALSAYKVTVSQTFKSPYDALLYLLKGTPFSVEQIGNVYVIFYPDKEVEETPLPVKKQSYVISGVLMDDSNGERLPYAHIQTNKGFLVCDRNGTFSITQETDAPVRIQAQYVGYIVLDTLLCPGSYRLALSPQTIVLDEVIVQPSPTAMLMQSGKVSGEIRINHQIAEYMPGSVENSVFNLLRMMPGVRASGEPSDLIVWGSNIGESQIKFDGFTLFGMKNFNDHITSVNPYLVKDIRLFKGGYGASQGNQIGAIAEITGIENNRQSMGVKANISNRTANVSASVPIKNSSLSAAYRQTFYNLFGKNETENSGGHGRMSQSQWYIKPDYSFRDANVKYSGKLSDSGNYYITLYGANDQFRIESNQRQYEVNINEENRQYAGSAAFEKRGNNGSSSKFQAAYTRFSSKVDNVTVLNSNRVNPRTEINIDNSIQDLSVKLHYNFNLYERQKIQIGAEYQQYYNTLNESSHTIHIPAVFITDHLRMGKLYVEAGVRTDFPTSATISLLPRISAKYSFSDKLTATTSGGMYRQYIARIPYQQEAGSYQMVWSSADSIHLKSNHALAGVAYSNNGYLFSLEGYFKQIQNGIYFLNNDYTISDNTIWGGDLYAKKEFGRQTLFASYSIANIEKPAEETGQEMKLGGIAAYKDFYFSTTYVYGTGYSYLSTGGHGHAQNRESDNSYNRWDMAMTYKLEQKKYQLQAGVSLLNVLNTGNVKYNYQLADQNTITNLYTEAIPRTFMVFVEIAF